MFEGYWGRPEATVDDEPQLVVPHRRHRPDRRRRLPVLRRPQGRLPAPPRREHLELRGRAHPDGPRRARRRRRARGAERDDRGRPQDHRDRQAEGATLTEEELFRWCIDQLPYFALPRYIEFRAELPRSPVGRVLKRELRDEGVTPTTWDVEPRASPTRSADRIRSDPRRRHHRPVLGQAARPPARPSARARSPWPGCPSPPDRGAHRRRRIRVRAGGRRRVGGRRTTSSSSLILQAVCSRRASSPVYTTESAPSC